MKMSEIHNLETAIKYCEEWKAKHKTCSACGIRKYCLNCNNYNSGSYCTLWELNHLQKIIAYGRKQKLKKLLS